jgi:hypothetical protein
MTLRSRFLHAAVDYNEMFQAVLALTSKTSGYPEMVENAIGYATRVLKKNHRIIWFLRWYKIAILSSMLQSGIFNHSSDETVEAKNKLQKLFDRELAKINSIRATMPEEQFNSGYPRQLSGATVMHIRPDDLSRDFMRNLDHFLSSAHLTKVQDFPFTGQMPREILSIFTAFEEEWNEEQENRERLIDPEEDDSILINFPNGWAWWELPRGSCDVEGKAMGHCGDGSHDNAVELLSLREPHPQKDGTILWEPHVTCSMDDGGFLAQMKGRKNQKPSAKYHPYLIALLEDPHVKGIKTGGYGADDDFSVTDLTPEQQKVLYEKKPILMPLDEYFEKFGRTEELINQVEAILNSHPEVEYQVKWDADRQGYIGKKYRNLAELVRWEGSRDMQDAFAGYAPSRDRYYTDWKAMLGKLPAEGLNKLGLLIYLRYSADVQDWEDRESKEYFYDDLDNIEEFIEFAEPGDVLDALEKAQTKGIIEGTKKDLLVELQGELKKSFFVWLKPSEKGGEWAVLLPFKEALMAAESGQAYNEYFAEHLTLHEEDWRSDYDDSDGGNAWTGWDEPSAVAAFDTEMNLDQNLQQLKESTTIPEDQMPRAYTPYQEEEKRLAPETDAIAAKVPENERWDLWSHRKYFQTGQDIDPWVMWTRSVIPGSYPFFRPSPIRVREGQLVS